MPEKRALADTAGSRGRPKKARTESGTKFYAVRAGKKPGVFLTWADCQAQTAGFKGAVYKAFQTRQDAEKFVAGQDPAKADEPERYYGVAVGNPSGVYRTWAEASLAIKDVKGPKYKRFESEDEALEFVHSFEAGAVAKPKTAEKKVKVAPKEKKKASQDKESSEGEDGGIVVVYTDGSSLSNGKVGASAGVGVYFGPNDERNISQRLAGEVQTNQRAELTAIQLALEATTTDDKVVIYTDSKYARSCVLEWAAAWSRNGWKTSNGVDVKNRDLIAACIALLSKRTKAGRMTDIYWVKGHESCHGNICADKLAVAGARMAPPVREQSPDFVLSAPDEDVFEEAELYAFAE